LWFQSDVDQDLDDTDASFDLLNNVGAIWKDLELSAGIHATPTLALSKIDLAVLPARVEYEKRETAGDYFECALACYFTRTPGHG
jgi:hypothetical protein